VFQSLSRPFFHLASGAGTGFAGRLALAAGRASRLAAIALAALVGSVVGAEAEDRTLKLFFTHTGERAVITYKRDGRFDTRGLSEMNRFLRDWRKNQSTRMDPRLFDLLWEIYDGSRANGYIHIVSGYRSPATNSMLKGRSRVSGVATKSQHMLGKAIDFYIPGVSLSTLRGLAIQQEAGGVGYYPTFVHVDVGNVRAWPRLPRRELARLFPNGRTRHLPSDGRPLAGYAEAVAQSKRRGAGVKAFEIARAAPEEDEDDAPVPSRRSIATAMLPSPRSRAEVALAAQIRPTASVPTPVAPAFADLAALAVPRPALRPVVAAKAGAPVAAPAPVEMAALQIKPSLTVPSLSKAFTTGPEMGMTSGQVIGRDLGKDPEQSSASIASLPITPVETEAEDAFDGQEALLAWAISAPGSRTGLTAPVVVDRALADHTPTAFAPEPEPLGLPDGFDRERFRSDG
jgi:uncharacterized protein YcbK (DUF882 family)